MVHLYTECLFNLFYFWKSYLCSWRQYLLIVYCLPFVCNYRAHWKTKTSSSCVKMYLAMNLFWFWFWFIDCIHVAVSNQWPLKPPHIHPFTHTFTHTPTGVNHHHPPGYQPTRFTSWATHTHTHTHIPQVNCLSPEHGETHSLHYWVNEIDQK